MNDSVVFVEIRSGSRNKYEYDQDQRYKDLEPSKKTETRGWGNRDEAAEILAASRDRVA